MKQKAYGPDQRNAFRNNYLAAMIAVMALFFSGDLFAQQNDSTRYNNNNSYGTRSKRTIEDSLSIIPLYESPHTGYRAGGLYYRKSDSSVYVWTGSQKLKISGTAGGAGIDTAYMLNDTTIAIETDSQIFFLIVKGTPDWHLTGNAGTDPSQFLGTTDEKPIWIATNGERRMMIDSTSGKMALIHGPDTLFIIADAEHVIQASTGTDLSFKTNDLVRLKVTASGFIGVGGVEPLEMLDVNGNVNARDAFIIYNPEAGTLRGELYHAGTYLGLRTITPDPIVISTDNTERSRYTEDGYFNVSAKTNLLDTATAPVMSDADSSNRVETTARVKRLLGAFSTNLTASSGLTKVGNDFRLGGTLQSNTDIRFNSNDLHLAGPGRLFIDTGRVVVGIDVDPLYSISVKKVYDNVTQANFATTVGKYPIYADKDVRFTEDSMSMWTVPGDNAGLSILRYKGQSIINFENTVNRFTAHHAVLSLEKHPSFNDTTIFKGRAVPYPAETCIPSGFSAILSQSQSGLNSTKPNLSKGWFAALSAEIQMGGGAFNKAENMIWIHTGGIGNAAANAITNGYGLYINPFGTGVTNKYAIYQQGTLDSNYFAGKIKMPNLTARTDTTLYKAAVIDASGNLSYLSYWPTGSGGGSGTVTSVGLSMPTGFSVASSPVTTSGTLAVSTTLNGIIIGDGSGFSAATTSAGISGVLSDETGSGSAVFATSPTITTPTISGQILNSADADIAHRRLTNTGTLYGLSLQNSLSQEMGGIKANNSGEVRIGAFRSTWFPTFYSNNTEAARITTAGLFAIGGGGTSSFPALKNNSGVMEIVKADNSGYASLASLGLTLSGLAGTGTRIGTVSSTGVSGAITNGTNGQVMTMVSGTPAWADKDFDGGSYTPTFSNLSTGVSSVTLPAGASIKWQRVKKTVTIWGNITPAFSSGATGDTRNWSMSLPPGITAVFTQNQDAAGIANCGWKTTRGAIVEADAANDLIGMSVEIGTEGYSALIGYYFTVSFEIP